MKAKDIEKKQPAKANNKMKKPKKAKNKKEPAKVGLRYPPVKTKPDTSSDESSSTDVSERSPGPEVEKSLAKNSRAADRERDGEEDGHNDQAQDNPAQGNKGKQAAASEYQGGQGQAKVPTQDSQASASTRVPRKSTTPTVLSKPAKLMREPGLRPYLYMENLPDVDPEVDHRAPGPGEWMCCEWLYHPKVVTYKDTGTCSWSSCKHRVCNGCIMGSIEQIDPDMLVEPKELFLWSNPGAVIYGPLLTKPAED